jgi:hypothetical protein
MSVKLFARAISKKVTFLKKRYSMRKLGSWGFMEFISSMDARFLSKSQVLSYSQPAISQTLLAWN